jgi:hypothetical protein
MAYVSEPAYALVEGLILPSNDTDADCARLKQEVEKTLEALTTMGVQVELDTGGA